MFNAASTPPPPAFSEGSVATQKLFNTSITREEKAKTENSQKWTIWCESPSGARQILNFSHATPSKVCKLHKSHERQQLANATDILTPSHSSNITETVARGIFSPPKTPLFKPIPIISCPSDLSLRPPKEKKDLLSLLRAPPATHQEAFFAEVVEEIQSDNKQNWLHLLHQLNEDKTCTTETMITLFEKMQHHHFSKNLLSYHTFFISIKRRNSFSSDVIKRLKQIFLSIEKIGLNANLKILSTFYKILLKGDCLTAPLSREAESIFAFIERHRGKISQVMRNRLLMIFFQDRSEEDSFSQNESDSVSRDSTSSDSMRDTSIDDSHSPPMTTRSPITRSPQRPKIHLEKAEPEHHNKRTPECHCIIS